MGICSVLQEFRAKRVKVTWKFPDRERERERERERGRQTDRQRDRQ